jgi:hypothetical protein
MTASDVQAGTWDAATLTKIIDEALQARDFPAVIAALKVLAVTDPVQAQAVLDTINLGLLIAGASDPAG